ncbi:MAG: C-GCAxxG-C-C family protein [Candidatus Thiodiazotropha sp.]
MSESADLVEKAESLAFDLEMKYGCCPQCVLTAVKDTVGGVSDDTIKASHGLSGGGGLMGQGACGALTGGLLALSTKRGRDADKLDKGRGMSNFQIGRKLVDRFVNEYGGVTCEALQQRFTGRTWDMWNPVEYKTFSDARGEQCARATGLVTRWVVESLSGG